MKIVYCDVCQDISILSNLEKDRCSRCGRPAQRVPYTRSWHYYATAGILLATAIFLWVLPPPDFSTRLVILGVALAVTIGLTSWSMHTMRDRIIKRVRAAKTAQEKRG